MKATLYLLFKFELRGCCRGWVAAIWPLNVEWVMFKCNQDNGSKDCAKGSCRIRSFFSSLCHLRAISVQFIFDTCLACHTRRTNWVTTCEELRFPQVRGMGLLGSCNPIPRTLFVWLNFNFNARPGQARSRKVFFSDTISDTFQVIYPQKLSSDSATINLMAFLLGAAGGPGLAKSFH